MSNNSGSGFWVFVALIAAMSVMVLIEALVRATSGLVARGLRHWRTAVPPCSPPWRHQGRTRLNRIGATRAQAIEMISACPWPAGTVSPTCFPSRPRARGAT